MKTTNIRSSPIEALTLSLYIEEKKQPETFHEQNQTNIISQSILLKKQIRAIQTAKVSLGVENLAASELPRTKMGQWKDLSYELDRAMRIHYGEGNYYNFDMPYWPDITLVNRIVSSMLQIAKEINQSEMTKETYRVALLHTIQVKRFEECICGLTSIIRGYGSVQGIVWSSNVSNQTAIYAAESLRHLIIKGGEKIADTSDVLSELLSSKLRGVREQGAIAAQNSFKYEWRKDINKAGLLLALQNEDDDSIRSKVAWAIAKADPISIVRVNNVKKDREQIQIHPITFIFTDRSMEVKEALFYGIESLCLAQIERGHYFSNFKEKPELSSQNRIDCFTTALTILEQLNNNTNLNEYQTRMLNRCCNILSYLASDEGISFIKSEENKKQYDEYQSLLSKLSQLDFIKFIKLVSVVKFSDSNWQKVDVLNNASEMIDRILIFRAKNYDNPLSHYFELQDQLLQIKKESLNTNIASKMDAVIRKIDSAIEHCLRKIPVQNIKWGTSLEFNTTVKNLLKLLESSKKESCKLAILNLFETLNKDGLHLTDGKTSLDKALIDSNKIKLRQLLKTCIYSSPLTQKLFLDPDPSSLSGKALLVYRAYKSDSPSYKSYKDYYGMSDLKKHILGLTIETIISKRVPKGLLLSGEPGTGKSMFAPILANEVALPLIEVKGSEIVDFRTYLNDVMNNIKASGRCVVLIDEINKIAPPSQSDPIILSFIKELQKLPVILIATTNSPTTDSIEGIPINEDGTSAEIDKALVEKVHPACLDSMQPCYFFHKRSVGSDFTKEYLEHLFKSGKLKEQLNIEAISNFGRGLIPFYIKSVIDQVLNSNNEQDKMISDLIRLQLGRLKILDRASSINEIISNLEFEGKLKINGPINYKKIAFVAEDLSDDRIEEILSTSPPIVTESDLLKLFLPYSGLNEETLKLLKKF